MWGRVFIRVLVRVLIEVLMRVLVRVLIRVLIGTKQHMDDDDYCPGRRETSLHTVRTPDLSNELQWATSTDP